MLGLVVIGLMGAAIGFWIFPLLKRNSPSPDATQGQAKVRAISKFPSPSEAQTLELVTRALAVRDEKKVESHFRLGNNSPSKVIGFLKDLETLDGPIMRFEWLSSMDSGGILMEGVLVHYQGEEKPVERIAFLTPDAAGHWKLDFAAFARLVEPPWDEVLGGRVEQALVRVLIKRDVYYNGPFSDDKQWSCYSIVSPDMDKTLFGYCKAGSAQAKAIEDLFSSENYVSRATLEIQRAEGAEKRQFEITRLLAGDWVVP